MAETKEDAKDDGRIEETTGRRLRTIEQTINDPLPPPDPSQEEADAILMGEYTGEDEPPPPEGETREQRQKREEDKRKQREAKAQADQAGYQTR